MTSIRVVGANPAMDRISTWPTLRMAEVNRARTVSVVPGGKGFNVARAAVRLGEPTVAYGFLGGRVGEQLREMIGADGVQDRHTTIAAGTRVCFIVVEPDAGRATVLNEPGPPVTSDEVERLLGQVSADLESDDLLVLSGSLPDSVEPDVAGRIVTIGRAAGARTLVDIHGDSLRAAVAERPWLLKCNRSELHELLGGTGTGTLDDIGELATEMQRLRATGIEVVAVTLGSDGALLADEHGVVRAHVPEIDEINPTGSGDLLLAGITVGIARGQQARTALALGAACGTAGATHLPPELPPDFEPASWTQRVRIEPVDVA
jgi:1-phosphofructokinase